MAVSPSRPDPSSPASVAEAGFSTARRGFHQDEVRAFLSTVAGELGRLQERERQLEAELRAVRATEPEQIELDDETITNLLGEETLRVLQTARESASQIKIRAEENAARIIREANDEANRLRQDAEVEAARRRQESTAEAEAEVTLAKQQGREMVTEARAYRERVLADLDRRTKLARQHIDELHHGRDRLLQVFERARLVAVDVATELQATEGPDEYVSLSPTTEPVPLMVPSDTAATRETTGTESTGPVTIATPDHAEVGADENERTDEARLDDDPTDADEGDDGDLDEHGDATAGDVDGEADVVDDEPSPQADGNVVALFRGREVFEDGAAPDEAPALDDDGAAVDVESDEPSDDKPDVGGIFERLRSEVPTDTPATTDDGAEGADDVTAVEPSSFSRRDEALVPLIVSGARKLKRELADEQNGVLDTLRHTESVTEIDALLPDVDDHASRYRTSIADELLVAAVAGATEVGASDTAKLRRRLGSVDATRRATDHLRSDLVEPLRSRIERAIADSAGDNDDLTRRVRAVYREWKTQHIDDQLDDAFRFAHGGGLAASIEPGTATAWTLDPDAQACPDCEDNSLAGPVGAGDAYPTGHVAAPAHPGCRCLIVPVPS